eukprot:5810434-Amphidinium_carterae.1
MGCHWRQSHGITTLDGMPLESWNDSSGWDAIGAKVMEQQLWMGYHWFPSHGMTTLNGMPLSHNVMM